VGAAKFGVYAKKETGKMIKIRYPLYSFQTKIVLQFLEKLAMIEATLARNR